MDRSVPIPGTQRQVWPGSKPAEAVDASSDILLTAWFRAKPGGDLDAVSARKLGETLPKLRTYASRSSLAQQTGADPADVELVRSYCEQFGLRVTDAHWRTAFISGPIERLSEAFGAEVAIFVDPGERRFRHRSGALHAPPEIAAALRGVFGLLEWPRSKRIGALQRHATPLYASDVVAHYQFPEGDGKGQTIGVVQFRGTFKQSDFDQCMHTQGIAAPAPIVKRVDNTVTVHEFETSKDLEAALDTQIVGALAPGARIVVYEAPDTERGFLDAIRTALFDEEFRPTVLSISYGWPEHVWTPVALSILDELFTAAALLGVSVFCSSGDHGAELDYDGLPHVLAPASSPFALACGATVLSAGDGAGDETAWPQTGGGFSEVYDVPSWQDAVNTVASGYNVNAGRGVPDVAAQEGPGYCVFVDGIELAMGGTSAIAPVWAALAARINQRLGTPIGFFAPLLYQGSNDGRFREITAGGNDRYQARSGWNPCTGLGVPIGTAIENGLRS